MHFLPPGRLWSAICLGAFVFMELIINSQKFGQKIVYFDEVDAEIILSCKWNPARNGHCKTFYASTRSIRSKNGHTVQMHRVIMGDPEGMEVDHIDGNGLNNRRNNLRICTRLQNSRNQGIRKNNTIGFKGVLYYKPGNRVKRYSAVIYVNWKPICGGYFLTAVEAAKRYNELALIHHGEFAKLNIIP